MATFKVTTEADLVSTSDGRLSLREAVSLAIADPAEDTINFAGVLEGKTLMLTAGQLTSERELNDRRRSQQ